MRLTSFVLGILEMPLTSIEGEISSWLTLLPNFIQLLNVHSAKHTGIVMTQNQTSELELTWLCEVPDNLVRFLRRYTRCIRVVVLHLWVDLHRFRVLLVLLGRCKHKFVVEICSPLRTSTWLGTKSIFPSLSCMVTWITLDGFSGSPGSPAENTSVSCLCPAGSEPAIAGNGLVTERTPIAATMVSLVTMRLLPFSNDPLLSHHPTAPNQRRPARRALNLVSSPRILGGLILRQFAD